MTRIAFIRHGVTAWNKAKRAQGSTDIPLDADGNLQAEKLAERVGTKNWDIIFSSDLRRAKQTAEAIQHQLGSVRLETDSRLREVDAGQMEGTTPDERIARWGPNWRELDLGKESHEQVLERGFSFLDEMMLGHEGKNIIVVSHGAFIRRLIRELLSDHDSEISLGNCSLTILQKAEGRWELELYNCMRHLQFASD